MTRKIFRSVVLVAGTVLLASLLLILGYLYDFFGGVQETQLKDELTLASAAVESTGGDYLAQLSSDRFRLTWIAADGSVLYDTQADASSMESHADREEVQQALKTGEGESTRYSATLLQKTLYYARRLGDGTVLRISVSRATAGLLILGVLQPMLLVLAAAVYWQARLPDEYALTRGGSLRLPGNITAVYGEETAVARSGEATAEAQLRLPLGVSVKTVSVRYVQRDTVLVSGRPFGIKMFTEGLMVVGFTDFSADGRRINPARSAGLATGDILLSLDGITLTSNEQMGALVQGSGGRPVQLVYQRQGRQYTARLTPQKSLSDSRWHLGLWVRDSSAGIGTVTYFDENARTFSGLGHPICDVDTGEIMTLSTGEGVEAVITGYTTGKSGSPGELKGQFVAGRTFAGLTANGECGVCGALRPDYIPQGERLPVAFSHEVQPGPAKMLTTIAGGAPREYDVVIEKVLRGSGHAGQNMVIRVTDEALLQKTGGILQGMSGSPLVQNGMLVGAVTHVFVDEPDRGYAIFAETVRNAEKNLDQTTRNAA